MNKTETNLVTEEFTKEFKNEVMDMISQRLTEYSLKFEENQENLNRDFMVIKRNTVDEVLKDVELNNYPLSDDVEQAITRIISLRLERSLSAPSRIGIKVYNNMTTDPE